MNFWKFLMKLESLTEPVFRKPKESFLVQIMRIWMGAWPFKVDPCRRWNLHWSIVLMEGMSGGLLGFMIRPRRNSRGVEVRPWQLGIARGWSLSIWLIRNSGCLAEILSEVLRVIGSMWANLLRIVGILNWGARGRSRWIVGIKFSLKRRVCSRRCFWTLKSGGRLNW